MFFLENKCFFLPTLTLETTLGKNTPTLSGAPKYAKAIYEIQTAQTAPVICKLLMYHYFFFLA